MKIGFIGCGNMASAIIKGAVSSNFIEGENIFVFDTIREKMNKLHNELNVTICDSGNEVVCNTDIVVLAVKPQMFPVVIPKIADDVCKNGTAVVSIGAGKTTQYITNFFDEDVPVCRVMPNINAKVGASMSAVCGNDFAGKELIETVKELCESFGEVIEISEEQFPLFSVIGGCSPAFVYMFIDSLARAGVQNGMSKSDALKISAQAVLGSAKTILNDSAHPWELVDNVCSPGGTTIEGVVSLQNDGFESSVIRAVNKSLEKDKKL